MKALLLKDFYIIVKQMKIILFIMAFFLVFPFGNMSIFAMIIGVMLPITTIAYDEQSKWDSYAKMLPYTPLQLVSSKYFIGFITSILVGIIAICLELLISLFADTTVDMVQIYMILGTFVVSVIVLSINLPLIFKFGSAKGRIGFMLVIAIFSLILASGGTEFYKTVFDFLNNQWVMYILAIFTIVSAVLSIWLSTSIYKAKN